MAEVRDYADLDPTAKAAEDAWAEEKAWPVFKVFLHGAEVLHVGRPESNNEPYMAPARAQVIVQAVNEDAAVARAKADNPLCPEVDEVVKVSDGVA
jgi:hypothetical protein